MLACDQISQLDFPIRAYSDRLREGDTLVVWKLDRLGRSMKDLVDLSAQLTPLGQVVLQNS